MVEFRSFTLPPGNGPDPFEVTVFEAAEPVRTVMFAAGGGGNPRRHLPLLQSLAERGCTVIAPHFEQLASSVPTREELLSRARRLECAATSFARLDLPVAGIGHSIGATTLLVLAGAQARTLAGQSLCFRSQIVFDRLLLFTPATDFFRAFGALHSVRAPIFVWAGTKDTVTPSGQAEFLRDTLEPGVQVEVRVIEGAGHFTFMNELPPHVVDPHPGRDAFLANLADEVHRIVTG